MEKGNGWISNFSRFCFQHLLNLERSPCSHCKKRWRELAGFLHCVTFPPLLVPLAFNRAQDALPPPSPVLAPFPSPIPHPSSPVKCHSLPLHRIRTGTYPRTVGWSADRARPDSLQQCGLRTCSRGPCSHFTKNAECTIADPHVSASDWRSQNVSAAPGLAKTSFWFLVLSFRHSHEPFPLGFEWSELLQKSVESSPHRNPTESGMVCDPPARTAFFIFKVNIQSRDPVFVWPSTTPASPDSDAKKCDLIDIS